MLKPLSLISDQDFVIEGRNTYYRSKSLCQPLANAYYQEHADYTIAITGAHVPFCNVICQHHSKLPSKPEIETILQTFKSKHLPFLWWETPLSSSPEHYQHSPDHPLSEYGLHYAGLLNGVCAHLQAKSTPVSLPAELRIKVAQ